VSVQQIDDREDASMVRILRKETKETKGHFLFQLDGMHFDVDNLVDAGRAGLDGTLRMSLWVLVMSEV
jgi:hypothetical protein